MSITKCVRFYYLFVIFCLAISPLFADSDYKAGAARTIITPESDIWLSGYAARDKPSDGKLHDLFAKALAVEDCLGNRFVLITTDLIGLSADLCQRVSKRVDEKIHVPRKSLMFTSSHTHSGPVLRNNLESMYDLPEEQWERITEYTKSLEDKLVDVVCGAVKDMTPAVLYRGAGKADFGVNRRVYALNGVNFGVNPIGPVDPDVPVMKVEDGNGNLMAIVFGYACHNTTLSIYQISGDYAGFAQAYLEERWPEANAMFFSGCGGDVNPHPRRKIELAKAHGRELSVAVEKVLTGPMKKIKGSIQTALETVDLPLTPAPNDEQLKLQLEDSNVYIQRRAKFLLKKIDKEGPLSDSYPYPIQAWSIGDDFIWLALAGEVVVDYSLLLKHQYGRDRTWVTAYANDVFAYVPSLRVLREGGYEAETSMIYYGLHGPWKPEIESVIVKTVQEMLSDMQL